MDFELIRGNDKLTSTDIGQTMARYYVHFESMKLYLGVPRKAKLSELVGDSDAAV